MRTFLELPHGIPSHDICNRVFSNIDSDLFESCFIDWVSDLASFQPKEVIAIDRKTIKGAKSSGKKSPIHMVSAWAAENNVILGQVKVNEKTNKISLQKSLKKSGLHSGGKNESTSCISISITNLDLVGNQPLTTKKMVTMGELKPEGAVSLQIFSLLIRILTGIT